MAHYIYSNTLQFLQNSSEISVCPRADLHGEWSTSHTPHLGNLDLHRHERMSIMRSTAWVIHNFVWKSALKQIFTQLPRKVVIIRLRNLLKRFVVYERCAKYVHVPLAAIFAGERLHLFLTREHQAARNGHLAVPLGPPSPPHSCTDWGNIPLSASPQIAHQPISNCQRE